MRERGSEGVITVAMCFCGVLAWDVVGCCVVFTLRDKMCQVA